MAGFVRLHGGAGIVFNMQRIALGGVGKGTEQTACAVGGGEQVSIPPWIGIGGGVGEGDWPGGGWLADLLGTGNGSDGVFVSVRITRRVVDEVHAAACMVGQAGNEVSSVGDRDTLAELAADGAELAVGVVIAGQPDGVAIRDGGDFSGNRTVVQRLEDPLAGIGESEGESFPIEAAFAEHAGAG